MSNSDEPVKIDLTHGETLELRKWAFGLVCEGMIPEDGIAAAKLVVKFVETGT